MRRQWRQDPRRSRSATPRWLLALSAAVLASAALAACRHELSSRDAGAADSAVRDGGSDGASDGRSTDTAGSEAGSGLPDDGGDDAAGSDAKADGGRDAQQDAARQDAATCGKVTVSESASSGSCTASTLVGGTGYCGGPGASLVRSYPTSGGTWNAGCTSGTLIVTKLCATGISGVYRRSGSFTATSGAASCDGNDVAISGGCDCPGHQIIVSGPANNFKQWACSCTGYTGFNFAYALCLPAGTYACLNGTYGDSGRLGGKEKTESCTGGQVVVGGGCSAPGGGQVAASYRASNGWRCEVTGSQVRTWVSCIDGT